MRLEAPRASGTRGRLLLIDRDVSRARLLAESLAECLVPAPELVAAAGGRQGAEALRKEGFEIVLADLSSLSDLAERAEDATARLVRLARGALVIAISEGGSVSAAVAAMRAGAHDYVAKPVSGPALAARIGELAERHGKVRPVAVELRLAGGAADFAGFVGASSAMQFVYEQIARIAPSAAPVFITGESGTGKRICAEALHMRGPRAKKPFVALDCAATAPHAMEAALFGPDRGAADRASGGTLLLDEIAELDLPLQSKLLGFLQTGTLDRAGGRRLDVRVICATNRNPMQMIADKRLREDLFYRLHVLPIHLPPLRQRPADVMVLARHFLEMFSREENKRFTGFSQEAAAMLAGRDWPGNVRQLQNVMRRLVVLFDGGEVSARMLAAADIDCAGPEPESVRGAGRGGVLPMWRQEQRIIEEAVARFNGNVSLAAAALEISPSTIYRKRQSWAEAGAA